MGPGAAGRAPESGSRYPLTGAQADKWLGSHYSAGAAAAFVEGLELTFYGELDVQALDTAFNRVVERHDALSVRFELDGSAQVYDPPSKVRIQHVNLLATADPHAAYAAFIEDCMAEPFNPAVPPLVRFWLCHLEAGEWRMVARAHHLVCDGWSIRVFLRELAARYNSLRGTPERLPEADSWFDYVRAEDKRRNGAAGNASLQYWLDQFTELPEPLRLPTDGARSATLTFAAGTLEHAVPEGLWAQLRTTARGYGVTRFDLLLASYFLLLHRLTGQRDFVCGVPFAGAARGAGARVIGDTGNTLPVRMAVDPDEPLPALLSRVHDAVRAAALHQDVSLGAIVRALQLPREPGRLMLVDSIVTLNPAIERLRFDGVGCLFHTMPHRASAWELAWQWRPVAGEMILEVHYHSDLYLPDTIRGWCRAYIALLSSIVQGSNGRVGDIDAGGGEFALYGEESQPAVIGDDEVSLPHLLEHAFESFSNRCAARCGTAEIDYATLASASGRFAQGLRVTGIGDGHLVGICMSRSIDMLVAVIGVLRAGAAYVPLDPAFPVERLRRMAAHAGLEIIVADATSKVATELVSEERVVLFDTLTGEVPGRDLPQVGGDALAYVLYTSGSTGEPKGVRILHRNLVSFLRAMRQAPGFNADDILCAATTLSFDIAALELYLPLLCGGVVVIADDREQRDPVALIRLIERHCCTMLQTTPSLLATLVEVRREQALQPLKLLIGGEAFPAPLANAMLPLCRELWNMYGPTETTVWSTVARINAPTPLVPLGEPIAGTRIYLLDAEGRPSMPGALGEIWIAGAGVADGYLHRPDLSAERFVEDPFREGERMYRTGDLGRIRGGALFFHGRADEQIKLRGYRIEPGEIEAIAAAEEGVSECVVVARDDGSGDQVLVLYAGSQLNPRTLEPRLRRRCLGALPNYMQPRHIAVLRVLPKTPNGKIDRRALPAPVSAVQQGPPNVPYAGADPVAGDEAGDALSSELVGLWRRLLQNPGIGLHDDFFELGGYSLLAVRMFTEIHDRHGVDLPLATLIENPTVATLAGAIRRHKQEPLPASGELDGGEQPAAGEVPQLTDAASPADGLASNSRRVLVQLRDSGDAPPLFLMHAVGGHVLNYLPIALALSPGRPVYGLQSAGLDGEEPPLDDIPMMAERYADAIREVYPSGPYLLAGGSMGGVVALEVARCLSRAAGEIAFLGMFDTYRPGTRASGGESPWRPHRWWSLYRSLDVRQRAALRKRVAFRLWQLPMLYIRGWSGMKVARQELLRLRVERSNHRALSAYRPASYPGRIVLFRAIHMGSMDDATLGWADFARDVEVVELAGRHEDIAEQPELTRLLHEKISAL